MHWTTHYKPKDCTYPFQVRAIEDNVGDHSKTEISFKKGDMIKVMGQCDADGHNAEDVKRTSKRVNEIMDVNYPVYEPENKEIMWIGELVSFEPADFYAKHKIGHFPVHKVQPMDIYEKEQAEAAKKRKEERERQREEEEKAAEEEAEREAEEAEAKAKAEEEAAAKAKAEEEAAAKAKAEEEAAAKAKELEEKAKKAQEELDRLEAEEAAEKKEMEDEGEVPIDDEEKHHEHVYVATHRQRTLEQAGAGKSRVRQRVLYAPSRELHKKSCLRRLKLPPTIPSTPIILIIGDLASLEDDEQERQLDNFRLGVLRAAASHDALIVDSGLASGMASAAPKEIYADYCKKVCTLGISPNKIEDPLSQYHTHQLIISDFNRWNDRQDEFVKHKLAMVRRLAGKCRVVCVLVNNGHTAWSEALEASKFGWPLILVQGSGDLANEIIYAKMTGQCYDFNIRQIVNDGNTCVLNSDCSEAELYSMIALNLAYDVQGIKKQIAYIPPKKDDGKKSRRAL